MLFPWPVLISISIFSRIVNKRSRLRLTREFLVCDWNEVDVRGFGYENASRRARESNNGTVIGSEYTVTLTSSRCKRVAIVNGFRPRSDCQQAESPHRTLPFFRTFFAPSSAHDASTDDDDGQSASSCLAKITPSLSLSHLLLPFLVDFDDSLWKHESDSKCSSWQIYSSRLEHEKIGYFLAIVQSFFFSLSSNSLAVASPFFWEGFLKKSILT